MINLCTCIAVAVMTAWPSVLVQWASGALDQRNDSRDHDVAQVLATSQRRMRSANRVALASGTFVEYLPSRRTQCRRPTGCRTSSMRYVGPPRFLRLMRMSAGSLGTNLTRQIL